MSDEITVTTMTSEGPVSVTSLADGVVPQPEYVVAASESVGGADFVNTLTPVDVKVAAPAAGAPAE
jgi:hypothetical protein